MIDFKKIELADKGWIEPLLRLSDFRGAEYCFTNLFVWSGIYQTKVCRLDNFLLIRAGKPDSPIDIYPSGSGDVKMVIEKLLLMSLDQERNFKMAGVGHEPLLLLQRLFPDFFVVTPDRNSWDYIYNVGDLSTLQGKRYQPKRNHIARFAELPDWRYERIGEQNIAECIKMNEKWCHQMGCTQNRSLYMEACAAEIELNNFDLLGLEGALLRVSGDVVAYTLGEPINSDTYIVHVEKAFSEIRGAYPMINREFMRDRGVGFKYVNREDDVGDEGLRTAKNSYHPAFMEEKYTLSVSLDDLKKWRSII
jgi:hypothetical protein